MAFLSERSVEVSADVLLNLLNEWEEKIRCEALRSILYILISSNELNKSSNTGARLQDSIYHITLKSHLILRISHQNVKILS